MENNRQTLRNLIKSGRSMDDVEALFRRGMVNEPVMARFERLFIWGTATEHYQTRHVPFARWNARRETIATAIRKL